MKRLLLAFCTLIFTSSAFAQIQKGDWTLGGDSRMGISKTKGKNEYDYTVSLNGNGGIFISDGFQLGATLGMFSRRSMYEKELDGVNGRIVIGPYMNYYLMLSDKNYWRSQIGIPLYVGWYTDYYYLIDDEIAHTDKDVNLGLGLQVATGVGHFINRIWGIEAMLNYDNYQTHDIYMSVGLRYFISTKLGDE